MNWKYCKTNQFLLACAVSLSLACALFAGPPARNEVVLTGIVQQVDPVTEVSCVTRLRLGTDPENVMDVIARSRQCETLIFNRAKIVEVSGICMPLLTPYGYSCQILVNDVKRMGKPVK